MDMKQLSYRSILTIYRGMAAYAALFAYCCPLPLVMRLGNIHTTAQSSLPFPLPQAIQLRGPKFNIKKEIIKNIQ